MVKKFKHRLYIKLLIILICKLIKNADPDKFKYSDFGIECGSCSEFLFTDVSIGKNVIFLEVI